MSTKEKGRIICTCGRTATHYVALLDIKTGEPNGKKKLMCDSFPKCRPGSLHHTTSGD